MRYYLSEKHRKIESKIIEKTEDKVRIAVAGGTVAFKIKGVEKIEEADVLISDESPAKGNNPGEDRPDDRDIVSKMATQDNNRSISGIKVLNVKCSETLDKAEKIGYTEYYRIQ